MKYILYVLAGILSSLVVVVFILGSVFFFKPDWLVNEKTMEKAAALAHRADVSISW